MFRGGLALPTDYPAPKKLTVFRGPPPTPGPYDQGDLERVAEEMEVDRLTELHTQYADILREGVETTESAIEVANTQLAIDHRGVEFKQGTTVFFFLIRIMYFLVISIGLIALIFEVKALFDR